MRAPLLRLQGRRLATQVAVKWFRGSGRRSVTGVGIVCGCRRLGRRSVTGLRYAGCLCTRDHLAGTSDRGRSLWWFWKRACAHRRLQAVADAECAQIDHFRGRDRPKRWVRALSAYRLRGIGGYVHSHDAGCRGSVGLCTIGVLALASCAALSGRNRIWRRMGGGVADAVLWSGPSWPRPRSSGDRATAS